MLIDRTHTKWIWLTGALAVAAVGGYLAVYLATPGGLTGGDLVGMWYGVAGSLLMLYAGSLSLLRRVPAWWFLGARKTWLRGHIWLGLLSGVLILCHSAGRLGGPLEKVLMAVLGLTLLTGVGGLLLQQFLPRLLTLRIASEAPYEQIPHLCVRMRQEADDRIEKARADGKLDRGVFDHLDAFYREQVRPFLHAQYQRLVPLAHPLQAETVFARVRSWPGTKAIEAILDWLETCCAERRQLGEQERLHFWLHSWLLVHVPLSVALLVLGVAHVVLSLYY